MDGEHVHLAPKPFWPWLPAALVVIAHHEGTLEKMAAQAPFLDQGVCIGADFESPRDHRP